MSDSSSRMDPVHKERAWHDYWYIQKHYDDGLNNTALYCLLEDLLGAGGHVHVLYACVYALKETARKTQEQASDDTSELKQKILELTKRLEKLESSNITQGGRFHV